MSFIPESIVRALCWTLLHSLWQGLLLAVVAGGVMLLTKRAPSAMRYRILGVLVMGFLAVSGYTFFRELRSPVAAAPSQAVLYLKPSAEARDLLAVRVQDGSAQTTGIAQLVQYFNAHASVVVVIWFIVFLARFVKILSGLVYAQRVRSYQTNPVPAEWRDRLAVLVQRLKISRPVRLLESALIKVPVTVGWLKPVILLPIGLLAQLPADQVESILLHELAHISRRDYLFNLAQNVVDTLFFFNPALLWVSSLIRMERENCCDDVAIRETRSRRQLIEALVSFHEYQQSMRGCAMAFAGKRDGMVKRVERIVHRRNNTLNSGERVLLMVGVLVLCGAFISVNREQIGGKEAVANVAKRTVLVAARIADTAKPSNTAKPANRADESAAEPAAASSAASSAESRAESRADSSDVELIIKAHDHGVTPEFVAELKKLGYTVNLNQAIKLMDHGVSVEFIRQVRALGFPELTLEDAVNLVDHGVTADFIEKWKAKTGSRLVLNDYIKLRDAGIDPS
jgi:bla regulator protein BlaR1